jgi:hypothetical protein
VSFPPKSNSNLVLRKKNRLFAVPGMNIGRSFAEAERSNLFCFRRPPINTDEDMVEFDFHLSSIGNRALSALRRGVCKSQVDGLSFSP